MNDFLLGIASFGLVLIPLVIIHEFGHFIAAKLSATLSAARHASSLVEGVRIDVIDS